MTLLWTGLVRRAYLDLILLVEIHGLGGGLANLVVPHGRCLVFRGSILSLLDFIFNFVKGLLLFQQLRNAMEEVLFQNLLSRRRSDLVCRLLHLRNAGLLPHFLEVVLNVRVLEWNCLIRLIHHRQLAEATRIWLLDHSLILDHEWRPCRSLLDLVLTLYLAQWHCVGPKQLQLV